jgi:hypothetical protein
MSTRAVGFAGAADVGSAAGGAAAGASGAGGRPPGPVSGVDTPPCAAFAPGAPHTALRGSVPGATPGSAVGAGGDALGGDPEPAGGGGADGPGCCAGASRVVEASMASEATIVARMRARSAPRVVVFVGWCAM